MKDASAENNPADATPPPQVNGGQTVEGEVKEKIKS